MTMNDSDVRAYKEEISKQWHEAQRKNGAAAEIEAKRLGRRWSLVHTAINDGVSSVRQLKDLVDNLTRTTLLPDDKAKTFKEAVSVEWHDADDYKNRSESDKVLSSRLSRRWSLVHTACNEGVASVAQLRNLITNLTHAWSLPDSKVKSFKEAVSVEWHDADDVQDQSKDNEILSKRLSRRWSLIHTAVGEDITSVAKLQHLLLHLTKNWTLPDNKVKTFKEAKSVEWHDADDLGKGRELSSQWSSILSMTNKKCTSVKKIQSDLKLETSDNLSGEYDDYVIDATSLQGMVRVSKNTAPTPAAKPAPAPQPQPQPERRNPAPTANSSNAARTQNESRAASTPAPAPKEVVQEPFKIKGMEWHCVLEGKDFGPLNLAQLSNMARYGIIGASTMVWKPGFKQWVLAQTVADLQGIV